MPPSRGSSPHCRQILYNLSHQGSPIYIQFKITSLIILKSPLILQACHHSSSLPFLFVSLYFFLDETSQSPFTSLFSKLLIHVLIFSKSQHIWFQVFSKRTLFCFISYFFLFKIFIGVQLLCFVSFICHSFLLLSKDLYCTLKAFFVILLSSVN